MAEWASVLALPDYNKRYAEGSARVANTMSKHQVVPPYVDTPKGVKMMEGAIGGGVAGGRMAASLASPAAAAVPAGGGSPPVMAPAATLQPKTGGGALSPAEAATGSSPGFLDQFFGIFNGGSAG